MEGRANSEPVPVGSEGSSSGHAVGPYRRGRGPLAGGPSQAAAWRAGRGAPWAHLPSGAALEGAGGERAALDRVTCQQMGRARRPSIFASSPGVGCEAPASQTVPQSVRKRPRTGPPRDTRPRPRTGSPSGWPWASGGRGQGLPRPPGVAGDPMARPRTGSRPFGWPATHWPGHGQGGCQGGLAGRRESSRTPRRMLCEPRWNAWSAVSKRSTEERVGFKGTSSVVGAVGPQIALASR